MTSLEFWPDYGAGPLWTDDGEPVDLQSLGLQTDLIEELAVWNGEYEEEKLPLEGEGDAAWMSHGRELLRRTRDAVRPHMTITVTEPWWRDPST